MLGLETTPLVDGANADAEPTRARAARVRRGAMVQRESVVLFGVVRLLRISIYVGTNSYVDILNLLLT